MSLPALDRPQSWPRAEAELVTKHEEARYLVEEHLQAGHILQNFDYCQVSSPQDGPGGPGNLPDSFLAAVGSGSILDPDSV